MEHAYRAFGLDIRSSLPFHQLLPAPASALRDEPEVVLTRGPLPRALKDGVRVGRWAEVNEEGVLLTFREGRGVHVRRDGRITVADAVSPRDRRLRLIVLGSAMGVLLQLRGLLPLHGSAVAWEGEGHVLLGESGAGKSTTAAWLVHRRGGRLVTDDIAAVARQGVRPVVRPAYRTHKLWGDDLAALGFATDELERVDQRDKYYVPAGDRFTPDSAHLKSLVLLETGPEVRMEPVPRWERPGLVMRHTYRRRLLHAVASPAAHLEFAKELADVPTWRLTRPRGRARLPEVLGVLESTLRAAA